MLEFAHIYPMDAVYDTPEDVPEEVSLHSFLQNLLVRSKLWYSICSDLWTMQRVAGLAVLHDDRYHAAQLMQFMTVQGPSLLPAQVSVAVQSGCSKQFLHVLLLRQPYLTRITAKSKQ